ncbi:MAG: hypothetical protein KBS53_00015 [Bacteroidales bacterium]|nr:hypothetical protein [Candidatus Hennigimonas equi]
MKKLFLSVVAAIAGCAAFSQTTVDLSVIGRLDANPNFYTGEDKGVAYSSGNSVIYTDLEASFGEHVAFTWIGHWLDTGGEKIPFKATSDLYKNSFYSNSNWTDFCYFDFMGGGFTFRLGKDCMAIGGFEYDPYDWEVTHDMVSLLWQNLNCYQWGASLLYTTPSEKSIFQLQAVSATNTIEYDEEDELKKWRPWQNGFGTYSFKYTGEYGPIYTSNAYGWMQTDGKTFGNPASGVEFLTLSVTGACCDQFSIGLEWQNRRDTAKKIACAKDFFNQSNRTLLKLDYTPSDKFEVQFIGGYEHIGINGELVNWMGEEGDLNHWFAGASFYYFPLEDSHDLRIQASVAGGNHLYTSYTKGVSATVGILYNHTFHIVK